MYIKKQNIEPPPISHTKNRFKELDALRGIAALMVVFFHFTYTRPQAAYGFFLGSTGVDLFFIISGFVIFMSLSKVTSVKQFVINRFARLFPAFWFCVTLTATIQVLALKFNFVHSTTTNISLLKYLSNLTMAPKYFGYGEVDGSYWTLLVEMLFYMCIALLMKFNQIINIVAVGCIFLILALANDIAGNIINNWPLQQIQFWFPLINHSGLFFAGILLYKINKKEYDKFTLYLLVLFCYIVQIKLYYTNRHGSGTINFYQYSTMLTVIFGIFILFVNNKLSFIINNITLFFGKISYSLYLIHQYIGANIILPGLEKILHLPFSIAIIITLAVIVLMAYFIYKFIEIPGGKTVKYWFKQHLN